VAISLRTGWILEGVTNRYIRYEGAGDQFVGRTVAGLPLNHADFAILGPFFLIRIPAVDAALTMCFPSAPDSMRGVLEFCLASVVYHYKFLQATIPATSPIFSSPLFRDPALLKTLTDAIVCRREIPGDRVQATGVPPSAALLSKMQDVADTVPKVIPAVIAGFKAVVEENAMVANTLTREGVEQVLNKVLKPVLDRLDSQSPVPALGAPAQQ
jgi:hypothetical protein